MELKADSGLYIGVLSGTSMDAVDVALCAFENNTVKLLHTLSYPYPASLKERMLKIIHDRNIDLIELGSLDYEYGALFADAVNLLIEQNHLSRESITAIGSHGQSLFHAPNAEFPFTLTLGSGQLIAEKTRIHTINDFRTRDILRGGQGAPLAPGFHHYVFNHRQENIAVVNIGGIANITFLPADRNASIQGYDTGPGNMLMDHWIGKIKQCAFDRDGQFAKSGTVHTGLLNAFLSDPYFAKSAPKSTGRELFNAAWLEAKCRDFPTIQPEDVQATLLQLTAQTIASELNKLPRLEKVMLCGGGAKNSFLVETLQRLMPCHVCSSDEMGVSADWMEAMLFAWLARETWNNRPGNCIHVTGAHSPAVLGALHLA